MPHPEDLPAIESPDIKRDFLEIAITKLVKQFGYRAVYAQLLTAGLHPSLESPTELIPPVVDEEPLPEIIGKQPGKYPGPGIYRSRSEKQRLEAGRRKH